MKMTDADERALAAVQEAMNYAPRDLRDKAWLGYGHIADRLAADQQKGGGEDEQITCEVAIAPATRFGIGVSLSTVIAAIRRRGEWTQNTGEKHTFTEKMKRITSPQPSSTAPAQQVIDEAMVARGVVAASKASEVCGQWDTIVQDILRAALAHPPHADHKEPQG